jgi:hypothetical protein
MVLKRPTGVFIKLDYLFYKLNGDLPLEMLSFTELLCKDI